MANNPYVNKVEFGNQTVMDISDTTANESDVAEGEVFYKGNGQRSVGTGSYYSPNDTAETDIADGDYFPFYDVSANSGNGAKRKSLWSNIKTKLKTYFDDLYATITDRDNLITEIAYADYQQLTQQQKEDPNKIYWCPDAPDSDDVVFPRYEQRVLGAKNFLKYPYDNTKVVNGITFTDNGDGTINVVGTPTGRSFWIIINYDNKFAPPANTYTFSIEGLVSNMNMTIAAYNGTTWARYIGTPLTVENPETTVNIDYSDYDRLYIYVEVPSDNSPISSPITVKPMIRLTSDTDNTWQPYAMTNRQLTEIEFYNLSSGICDSVDGSIDMTLVKCGKVVQLSYSLANTNKIPAGVWTAKATIKREFRPYANVYAAALNSGGTPTGWCQLLTNGIFRFYHSQNVDQQFAGTLIYILA